MDIKRDRLGNTIQIGQTVIFTKGTWNSARLGIVVRFTKVLVEVEYKYAVNNSLTDKLLKIPGQLQVVNCQDL